MIVAGEHELDAVFLEQGRKGVPDSQIRPCEPPEYGGDVEGTIFHRKADVRRVSVSHANWPASSGRLESSATNLYVTECDRVPGARHAKRDGLSVTEPTVNVMISENRPQICAVVQDVCERIEEAAINHGRVAVFVDIVSEQQQCRVLDASLELSNGRSGRSFFGAARPDVTCHGESHGQLIRFELIARVGRDSESQGRRCVRVRLQVIRDSMADIGTGKKQSTTDQQQERGHSNRLRP